MLTRLNAILSLLWPIFTAIKGTTEISAAVSAFFIAVYLWQDSISIDPAVYVSIETYWHLCFTVCQSFLTPKHWKFKSHVDACVRCVALRCAASRCVAMRRAAMRCAVLRCVARRCFALRCVVLRRVTLRSVALGGVALQCFALCRAGMRSVAIRRTSSCRAALRCALLRADALLCATLRCVGLISLRRAALCFVALCRASSRCVTSSCAVWFDFVFLSTYEINLTD